MTERRRPPRADKRCCATCHFWRGAFTLDTIREPYRLCQYYAMIPVANTQYVDRYRRQPLGVPGTYGRKCEVWVRRSKEPQP